jgi:hypothetical protein
MPLSVEAPAVYWVIEERMNAMTDREADFVTPSTVTKEFPTFESLTAEFAAELSSYVAVEISIADEAEAAYEAVRAARAREPELDPLRLNLGRLLIRIRPSIGDVAVFEEWCSRHSTDQFSFSMNTAYRWMKIAGSKDPEKEYLNDRAKTAQRVREFRARERAAKAFTLGPVEPRPASSASITLLGPVEPRLVGHIQVLPEPPGSEDLKGQRLSHADPVRRATPPDFAAGAQSVGRSLLRQALRVKEDVLKIALELSREDLDWLRDRIEEHLAETTEEKETTPFEFAPEPEEETTVAPKPRLRRGSRAA